MSWSSRFGFLALAALAMGACQPLYAERHGIDVSVGTPVAAAGVASPSLAAIDILPIDGRVGQKIRNDLIFNVTGGGAPIKPPLYRLDIAVQVLTAQIAIVDPFTDRPELQTAGVDAAFALIEVGTGKPVMSGNAMGRATYTRNRQRFASTRAQRDAEDRAAKIVVEQIRGKVMAHFSGAQPGT
jgi:LPS-assembly lipoprotein